MKLRKLHIEDYKMFKDFDMSFMDKKQTPLPLIIIAGCNSTGKTTLLEYIKTFSDDKISADKSYIRFIYNNKLKPYKTKYCKASHSLNNDNFQLNYNLEYFPAGIDDTKKIADEFVKTFYDFLKNKDYRPSEVKEHFHNYMKNIFDGLEVGFKYSHLDRDDNVWFVNDNGEEFEIKDLSTGEKTLLSKVMYLYFLDYKEKVILIDEPELSLHPSWQNRVLKIYENFAKQNNCQIIIATHSPHIIGSAKPEYIRILKKVDDKIEVEQYNQSYGLEFSQILTDIMGLEYLRTPDVAKRMDNVKALIIENRYDSDEFKEKWQWLEENLGKNYLDLKLLKLEIASRRKNASNS